MITLYIRGNMCFCAVIYVYVPLFYEFMCISCIFYVHFITDM
jgi:hypothetical protein